MASDVLPPSSQPPGPILVPPEARPVPVTPRAYAVPDGEPLPLHDHVRRLLARGATGIVNVFGPRGSGKSTALRHLAAVFPPGADVALLDDRPVWVAGAASGDSLVVLATRARTEHAHLAAFRMAPWGDDDLIEYLLNVRRDRCDSVMARLKDAPSRAALGGSPELWAVVLGEMIAHDSVATPADALREVLASKLGDESDRLKATAYCLKQLVTARPRDHHSDDDDPDPPADIARIDPAVGRLIGHYPVQLLLAAQRIVWDIAAGNGRDHLDSRLPDELLDEVAGLTVFRGRVMEQLRGIVRSWRDRRAHPTAAAILHATHTGWRPEGYKPILCGARLTAARWAGVDLACADLAGARLAGADLYAAKLDGATAAGADLAGASLREASLHGLRAADAALAGADVSRSAAAGADFSRADLRGADLCAAHLHHAIFTGADLTGAKLRAAGLCGACLDQAKLHSADLTGADLAGARLTGVDLSGATLAATSFDKATLSGCDLQGVELPGAMFGRAVLSNCDLAESVMPRACFRGAVLRGAGLARVRWELADLRDVDFTGSSFHTGSSRSGLVGSVIASEGTRTGFYTDDYDDRGYKPPEQIRTADLFGADLRGAKVKDVDFYLVDLRAARYTPDQVQHFRRCGAIL